MSENPSFSLQLTALPEHIDELGHVNNAVWVQWIQQVALAHWYSLADPRHAEAYFWVIVRHEIDYLRPAFAGDTVTGRTWVGGAPRGAKFDRWMEFTGPDGKLCVKARTWWAIIDKAAGRPIRVPPEVVAPFLAPVTSAPAGVQFQTAPSDGSLGNGSPPARG